jgi:hypothetical protein
MLHQHSSWCVVGKWLLLHREAHLMKTIIQMSEAEEEGFTPAFTSFSWDSATESHLCHQCRSGKEAA